MSARSRKPKRRRSNIIINHYSPSIRIDSTFGLLLEKLSRLSSLLAHRLESGLEICRLCSLDARAKLNCIELNRDARSSSAQRNRIHAIDRRRHDWRRRQRLLLRLLCQSTCLPPNSISSSARPSADSLASKFAHQPAATRSDKTCSFSASNTDKHSYSSGEKQRQRDETERRRRRRRRLFQNEAMRYR